MKAIFGFPNLLRKKIILQILVTEKRVFGTQYGNTGISFSCGPQLFLTKGSPWLQAILKSLVNRIN